MNEQNKVGCFVFKQRNGEYYFWEMYSSERFYLKRFTPVEINQLPPFRVGDSFCAVYNPYDEVFFFKEFISFKEFLKRLGGVDNERFI